MGDQGGRDLDLALHEGEHNYHNIDLRSQTSPIIQQQQYKKNDFSNNNQNNKKSILLNTRKMTKR